MEPQVALSASKSDIDDIVPDLKPIDNPDDGEISRGENESGSDVRADGNGDEKISGSEQPSVEEGGDGTADPESDFRLALNLTDEEKIDVTIRSVAEIEEEERLAAEMAEKLSWLDELWQLEQETEEELRLADAESDEELEKRREMGTKGVASTSKPQSKGASTRVRSQTEAAMRFDSQIAKSRATKVLEDLRGMEAKIRATRDEMDAIERLIKDLQSQIESIEQEASRKSSIKAYETGAGATTRQKWTEASLAEAYDKLDDAFIRLQTLQEIHYSHVLERNATEVDLAGLESDIELSEAQGAEGTLGVKERSALVVEREAERADAHVRGHWARHEALARARREAEREAEALRRKAVHLARDGRLKGILRIREKVAKLNERMEPITDLRDDLKERRIRSLLQLKKSVDAAQAELVRRNEMRERKLRDRQHRQMEQWEALVEAGMNPYEVFRQREIEERLQRRRAALAKRVEKAEARLMEQMIREDELYNKEMAAKRVEEEYNRKFQDEMGVLAKEKKLRRWMVRHNRTGKELLDPTNRVPVHPSEVAVVKPPAFGLGRADAYSLDLVRNKFGRNVQLVDSLLPRRFQDEKDVEDLPDDPASGKAGQLGRTASRTSFKIKPDQAEDPYSSLAQTDFAPLWDERLEGDSRVAYRPLLSKAELQKLERLKREHKESVNTGGRKPGETTIVMGREFKGAGFLLTPKEVVFKDFEVGEKYRHKITLTNVFWTKNTFKVMEMPPEVRNFFEVEYNFPGLVSAGITCDVYVNFEPKMNEDISTHIPIITQTGPITIPVRCLRKRATLSLSSPVVSFQVRLTDEPGGPIQEIRGHGHVSDKKITIGETKEAQVQIVNNGALSVDFKFEVISVESAMKDPPAEQKALIEARDREADDWAVERLMRENVHASRLKDVGLELSDWKGQVRPYSRTTFSLSFKPPGIGMCTAKLRAVFTGKENTKEYIPDVELTVSGDAADLPVVCESLVLDMKCMVRGQAYTQQLRMVNRSSVSVKCFLQRHPILAKYLQVYPGVGYVQAHDTFSFSLKLKPTTEMLDEIKSIARVSRDGDDGDFEIPMRVAVPDQALPATFTLKGSVTTSDILLEPKSLDFGECALGEATGLHLTMTNMARLPQKYGFCNLRRGLQVQPNDGFGTLLPGQTVSLVVSYTPDISGTHKFPLDLRTLLGRHIQVPCRATVTPLSVSLDRNKVTMPATEVGRTSQTSVRLSNQSSTHAYTFQFAVPASSRIKVSPNVGRLAPGSVTRVEVAYTPREEDFEDVKGSGVMHPGSGKENEGPDSASKGLTRPGTEEAHNWVRRGDWTVACYLREEEAAAWSAKDRVGKALSMASRETQGLQEEGLAAGKEVMPIHLQVVTSAKLPELVLDGPVEWRPEIGCYQMAFGEVALGQRVLKTLIVFNNGPRTIQPQVGALHHRETFSVVNRSRPTAPQEGHGLLLAYCPERAGKHREILYLKSQHSTVKVALVGTGISPSFDVDKDSLDLGDVYRGETASESFTIENTSPFPLKYKLQLKEGAHTNIGGTPVFVVKPSEGTIPSEGTQEVEVTFLPDHEYLYFENTLSVLVPNQEEDVTVRLQGRCWEKGMYLIGGDKVTAIEDPFKSKQLAKFEGLKPAIPMVLTFPNDVFPGELSSGVLQVGNLSAAAGKDKGEFVVVELSHGNKEAGWSVEPQRGVVDPGTRSDLTFHFRCPDDPGRLNLAYLDMGGWIEASIDVILKGGYPPPKDDGGTIYRVRARCYIKPAKKKKAAKKGLRFRS